MLQRSERKKTREPGLARASSLGHMGEKAKLRCVLCEMIQMVNYSHSREIKPTLVQVIHVRMEQIVCDNRNMGRKGMGRALKRSGRVQKRANTMDVRNTPVEGQYDKHGRSNRSRGRNRAIAGPGNVSVTDQW